MVVFAYAGQGSQYVSMGTDIYEAFPEYKKVLDKFYKGEKDEMTISLLNK